MIEKTPTIYNSGLTESDVERISSFHFTRYYIKVNSFSQNKIAHDSDLFVVGVNPNEKTLFFDFDEAHKVGTIGGYFNATSNISITQGTFTEVFTGDIGFTGNSNFRSLFFDKSSNKFYPCYVVLNNGHISVRFAQDILSSFIDVINTLTSI